MKIENCKIDRAKALKGKSFGISIRLTADASAWLKKESISPTALFNEAMKELGYKPAEKVADPKK